MNVTVERVSAGYRRTRVLDDLSWRLRPGVTGLLGPNGAGKTTLLHLLAGIARPWRGSITAQDGTTAREYSRRVGFLPQHFTLAEEMRLGDTVTYAAWVNGVAKRDCPAAAWTALETVDLHGKARDRVRSLSGGQRQRLGLATALAHEPDLLILDEPTVGLDPAQRLRLREAITAIGAARTVVISTHLIEDVTHMCDRVGVLAGGRMAFDGTIDELARLVDDDAEHGRGPGSPFERAYAGIVARLEREA